ncbi:PREDICTED: leucine-rich repeat receptor protein kinase EMS1-like [Ipomoea nil]|uniref:leucine-rich repeat receptor protein kinase EMS1-like n=1 Tax=Ipomoea nil TaxID=35883 RepID=UPI000900A0BB|nr:PREDICTED: leucine-rich repeat receptor protein kinase EMS1-like [Ipomoea nil]
MGVPLLLQVLVATGSIILLTLIAAFVLVLCRISAKRRYQRRLSSASVSESATFDPTDLNPIDMGELIIATKDFSPELIIGDGSFGLVYKAKLSSGLQVAVKKLSADAFQGFREFRAEMETLGKIRHPNIVKMFGYCSTGLDRVLIYELVKNGSLDQWLYYTSAPDVADTIQWEPLNWETRIKIVKGVAKGLAYMHSLDTPIIHRDIKASNILLDENFEAHIADFGLARRIEGSLSHVSTQVAGTMGYMPPEYINGATRATAKGDIYSFGVLMLEIITGRRPNFPFTGENGHETRLVDWASNMVSQYRYNEIIDSSLYKHDIKENDLTHYFNIAIMCSSEAPKARPAMDDVIMMLNKLST